MRKLARETDESKRIFFGVAGGIGSYFNIDPMIIRLLCLYLFLVNFVAFGVAYITAIFIIPEKESQSKSHSSRVADIEPRVVEDPVPINEDELEGLNQYKDELVLSEGEGLGYDEEKLRRVREYLSGDMTNQEEYEAVNVDIEQFIADRYPQEEAMVGTGIIYEGSQNIGKGVQYPIATEEINEVEQDVELDEIQYPEEEIEELISNEENDDDLIEDSYIVGEDLVESEPTEENIDEEESVVTRFNPEEVEDDSSERTHYTPSYYRSRK